MSGFTNDRPPNRGMLFDPAAERSSCGVGFITDKTGEQTHDVLEMGHEALCAVPHRGGMSSMGIGDGAGCNIDLSERFFSNLTQQSLEKRHFGVANILLPKDPQTHEKSKTLVLRSLASCRLPVLHSRIVPTNDEVLSEFALGAQAPVQQFVFGMPEDADENDTFTFEQRINQCLIGIEAQAYSDPDLVGFYPLSMSSRTQVLKGRLLSHELVRYFADLSDPDHEISIFMFHTRFSTNTRPAAIMAQPFRWIAHNGELNTDKKNRLSEDAIARANNKQVIFPRGQSDSGRLDQTIARRIIEDEMDIVTAVVAMMPPAWENDKEMPANVRAMFEYFSLYEEKNDGPAALIFNDGIRVGARLDRLGLRPLRSIETERHLVVTSEAGQIDFEPSDVIRRGRIEAGGILYFDHERKKTFTNSECLSEMAARKDYAALVAKRSVHIDELPAGQIPDPNPSLTREQRYVAYGLNQESFKFFLDPMAQTGAERVGAMGFGLAVNAIYGEEGGIAKYLSQRFAQVTNPPLDSVRETDGMTLRVALGPKPHFTGDDTRQIVLDTPIMLREQLAKIRAQQVIPVVTVEALYEPKRNADDNETSLKSAVDSVCDQVENAARNGAGIVILSDREVTGERAAIPIVLATAAANQRLVRTGIRFNCALLAETGQVASSHDYAVVLGMGASAVCSLTVPARVETLMSGDFESGLENYRKAAEKALLKTMGKFGLCTVESYIGGEFFESNFMNTQHPVLAEWFPNIDSPVGGAGFSAIAANAVNWHFHAIANVHGEADIPILGLFKERTDKAGHTFGLTAVREFLNMTDEGILYSVDEELRSLLAQHGIPRNDLLLKWLVGIVANVSASLESEASIAQRVREVLSAEDLAENDTLRIAITDAVAKKVAELRSDSLRAVFGGQPLDVTPDVVEAFAKMGEGSDPRDGAYQFSSYERRTPEQIDRAQITPAYRSFLKALYRERWHRPAALRDIVDLPVDVTGCETREDFETALGRIAIAGNRAFCIRGLIAEEISPAEFRMTLVNGSTPERLEALSTYLRERFGSEIKECEATGDAIRLKATETADVQPPCGLAFFLRNLLLLAEAKPLTDVQPAHEITRTLSTGAMSHGALTGIVHEAVAMGANIAGALSNSGEGGERASRFNTIRSCAIKQVASGRFGVWAGYLADPRLQEIEIKIAQGAKPGEGGQLPGHKVTVEIAALRGGTPKIELVSPPPHHDTYSIEDLAQLIHDCHATRKKVIVKLVSSEGIGTIAVGVAKAGADVINVAGSTGGTGAASVTSLKHTGRAAEIGIAEVHQALCDNGIRDKVVLRASNAHQSGLDVIKSAILGADSYEFGTTALMMLKCVMAKNCNVKCPAGLTTNPESFSGDARALAQFLINVAHEVREILASLGCASLADVRGKTDLLHLIDHPSILGALDLRSMLADVTSKQIPNPKYISSSYRIDDAAIKEVTDRVIQGTEQRVVLEGDFYRLSNRDKTVGGQLSIDIERILNHLTNGEVRNRSAFQIDTGRRFLAPETVTMRTTRSAGQSYGCWLTDGLTLEHTGTCNDGVGKGMCGGKIVVRSPGGGTELPGENVLIGNFALFGASGGELYVEGEAGDRFAVRNSGALAVVEGVGEFCCEYMTNGMVVNLGHFGKGFGNGMSGGNAYQYDPHNRLPLLCNPDSVVLAGLGEDNEEAHAHSEITRSAIADHVRETGSGIGERILANWDAEKAHFKSVTPRALYATQTVAGISAAMNTKEMIEELAIDLARQQLEDLACAYRQEQPVLAGETPAYGDLETPTLHRLVSAYTTMTRATEFARAKLSEAGVETNETLLQVTTRNAVLFGDKKLIDTLTKEARGVLQSLSDEDLTKRIAIKRVRDYKTALTDRDTWNCHSRGAMAWILQQNRLHAAWQTTTDRVEEQMAANAALALVGQ